MENGELYFSFTYAHGGTLKLGGSNNGNGLLSILNASGTQVGYIDNTGVHFNQGESKIISSEITTSMSSLWSFSC